jgi:nitrogen-specific signal transduction histidine kinase
MEPRIDFDQALDILYRLESAAPPNTAAKLAQVTALLKQMEDENNYLNSLVLDNVPALSEPMHPKPMAVSNVPMDDYADYITLMEAEPYADDHDLPAHESPNDGSVPTIHQLPNEVPLKGLDDALRPPLVAIRGRAELVQDGFLGQTTSEQNTWLEAILENTNRAFAVLDAVQEMLALQTEKVRIRPVNFLSTDLLTEVWERTRDRAKLLGHTVTIQAPDIVPLACGDFYQSLIILTDLVDNAMRYTPRGGQIKLSVDNLGTHVLLSVADNGIGLTPDDIEHIGIPFWRGSHHKLVRAHAGTGLRLYLAKQILAMQNGELIFTGEPGTGSTFSFTLPIPD